MATHERAVVPTYDPEPRERIPNDNGPGPNEPPQSVGPTSSEGFGNTHVMYPAAAPPPQAEAWSGWPVGWATPAWNSWGAGPLASKVAVVMMSVDFLSRNLATMPVVVSKNSEPLSPQPMWTWNPAPLAYAHIGDFTRQVMNTLLLRGEAIVAALRRDANDRPDRFIALNPDHVQVDQVAGRPEYRVGNAVVPTDDVCHIRYQSWPGMVRGIGPLEWLARSLIGAEALERLQLQATIAGVPWGVLTHPDRLSREQADDLKLAWLEARSRGDGAPAVLSGGITLTPFSLSPRDMMLLELREMDEARIAAGFGLFPFLLGLRQEAGSLVYQNVTQLYGAVWRQTMRPLAVNIAQALSYWALPHQTTMHFDSEAFVRPELAERVNAYAVLHSIQDDDGRRALSVDEIRAMENLPTAEPAEPVPPEGVADVAELTGGVA